MNLLLKTTLLPFVLGVLGSAAPKIQNGDGYNILFFHAFATSSHRTAIWPLAERLADSGHNVTYIFPVNKKIGSHPRIQEITPSKMVPILTSFVSDFDINIRLEGRIQEWLDEIFKTSFKLCEAFYESPEVREWMAQPNINFDLILIDGSLGECGYGLVQRFRSKHILFMPLMIPFLFDGFGIVPESSSTPDVLTHPKPAKMGLYERMISTMIPLLWRYKFEEYLDLVEPVIRQGLNETEPVPLREIESNTSLIMVNSHFVEEYPLSLPPMVVSYSGLWCSKDKLKATKPLPKNIADFVDKSAGFFYVSFGSATVASAMPIEMRNKFFNSFRAFPKHRFLWRWTGPVPNDAPENLLLLPWFPQHDILAHPKLKAFMTQTGRPSTQEALCYGVPLITMPIFGDQDYNADRLEYIGATINLDIATFSEETLTKSFSEIMDNPGYRERMKELSEMFRDRPLDPLDNVHYWTEYVMRHNTTLLKPLGMHQTWYQRRLLDVYAGYLALLLVVAGVLGGAVFYSTKLILATIVNRFSRNNDKSKVE